MIDRRSFMKLSAVGGGVVFASALQGCASALQGTSTVAAAADFHFVQLSDTHWGFEGPPNPCAASPTRRLHRRTRERFLAVRAARIFLPNVRKDQGISDWM